MVRKLQANSDSRRRDPVERRRRVEELRREVATESYEDKEKLRIALDRMIDRILERSK